MRLCWKETKCLKIKLVSHYDGNGAPSEMGQGLGCRAWEAPWMIPVSWAMRSLHQSCLGGDWDCVPTLSNKHGTSLGQKPAISADALSSFLFMSLRIQKISLYKDITCPKMSLRNILRANPPNMLSFYKWHQSFSPIRISMDFGDSLLPSDCGSLASWIQVLWPPCGSQGTGPSWCLHHGPQGQATWVQLWTYYLLKASVSSFVKRNKLCLIIFPHQHLLCA